MVDMFGQASQGVPDNTPDLFSKQVLMSAIGTAGQAFTSAKAESNSKVNSAFRLMGNLDQNVQRSPDNRQISPPTKTKSAATEDPQEVEARWMARLAKYAGISQATGVKLGSL